jgi:hypothetical protein
MTHHQLGQKEPAEAALARLREAVQQARGNNFFKETHDLLQEAEALMGAKARGPEE